MLSLKIEWTEEAPLDFFNTPGLTFGVIEKEAGDEITRQKFPQAKTDTLPLISKYSQLFQEVATKKADAAVIVAFSFFDFDKSNPGKLVLLPLIVSKSEVDFAPPNKDIAFANMIDGAVREIMIDDTVKNILKKHNQLKFFPVPDVMMLKE